MRDQTQRPSTRATACTRSPWCRALRSANASVRKALESCVREIRTHDLMGKDGRKPVLCSTQSPRFLRLLTNLGYRLRFVVAAVLVGCSVSVGCEFTNLAGTPVEVVLIGKDVSSIGMVGPGETVRIDNWIWRDLQIKQASGMARYKVPLPPSECVKTVGWGPFSRRVFRAELREDGKIHLDCSEQNTDFPIAPVAPSGRDQASESAAIPSRYATASGTGQGNRHA